MTDAPDDPSKLRTGFTTGACAAAATAAACARLFGAPWPDPVSILLPRGQRPSWPLATRAEGPGWAMAGVEKDAGDD
ncbi:MAG: cobalt-precorrin-5B (C(1))-methyltransferase, partial [Pseudomonadota bacterium]